MLEKSLEFFKASENGKLFLTPQILFSSSLKLKLKIFGIALLLTVIEAYNIKYFNSMGLEMLSL